MFKQRMVWTVWPAFLMAGVIEVLVFSLTDPQELSNLSDADCKSVTAGDFSSFALKVRQHPESLLPHP